MTQLLCAIVFLCGGAEVAVAMVVALAVATIVDVTTDDNDDD